MHDVVRTLHRLKRDQTARDAETFATALELDLLDAGDLPAERCDDGAD